ncbi:MAG: iron dependent repressor, metal binding and dimerization domain protein [Nitrospinota bacterium]|nr:iron dependent repressor, metal binding and dimerization domain protein [Nitrospinota bacterium]
MIDPVRALLIAGVVGAAAAILFWPVRGIFRRCLRAFRATGRVQTEDALKHLYDCEHRQIPCTLYSLCGALNISGNRAADLLARLEELEWVTPADGGYRLMPDGRSYALRVVRVHRLWERFLSDRTGLGATEWHHEAERREHTTSPEEADALATRMGNPRFDPHGDPIPTAPGDVPPPLGRPLTELAVGELAAVVHVEDEPQAVHAQLVAESLHPGMRVRVLETHPQRIRFEADAEEHVLAPVVAANLSVMPLAGEQKMAGPFARLSGLEPGQRAEVVGISRVCRGPERRRMLDLGIIPGTAVKAELRGPGGDPTAYRIRGAVIALRRQQSDLIHVHRMEEGDPP